jgi:hypothetical protein
MLRQHCAMGTGQQNRWVFCAEPLLVMKQVWRGKTVGGSASQITHVWLTIFNDGSIAITSDKEIGYWIAVVKSKRGQLTPFVDCLLRGEAGGHICCA